MPARSRTPSRARKLLTRGYPSSLATHPLHWSSAWVMSEQGVPFAARAAARLAIDRSVNQAIRSKGSGVVMPASVEGKRVRGEVNAGGEPQDPKQGRSNRATPKRHSPHWLCLVLGPASSSSEMARRQIEQFAHRPRSIFDPDSRRRRLSKLERKPRDESTR